MSDEAEVWTRNKELEQQVRKVAREHEEFAHLRGRLKIAVVMRPKAGKKGMEIATTRAASELICALLEPHEALHYVVTIGADAWAILDEEQRAFVLRHEMRHCIGTDPETGKVLVRHHDAEVFFEDLADGLSMNTIKTIVATARKLKVDDRQLRLLEPVIDEEAAAGG